MLLAAALASVLLTSPTPDGPLTITTHQGQSLTLAEKPATVLVFLTTTCPIARSMQPTLTRLHTQFSPQQVQFLAVQIDPTLTKEDLQTYINDYKTPLPQFVDKSHLLVKTYKAKITPEAVVLNKEGKITYQGRIDNTYPEIGVKKTPTSHDLQEAITATLAGKPPTTPKTTPIGCIIPNLEDF